MVLPSDLWLRRLLSLPVLIGALLAMAAGSLFVGAYTLQPAEVFAALWPGQNDPIHFLLIHIRLPRILLAGTIGAGLAISGAAIQGLFRNPLADQTLIGVTSGAMLFAVLSIVLMSSVLAVISSFFRQASTAFLAFLGGLGTTYFVYFLSRRRGKTDVTTMLLAGIAISAFSAAIAGLFIYLSTEQQLRDITFWSLGSISAASWTQVALTDPVVGLGIWVLRRHAPALNAILMGETEAFYLGIPVERVKRSVILVTALIVGACIAMSGIIGFVGLIIPHLLRLLGKSDYRFLLTRSALVGAFFLVGADTLARTLLAPAELPIGLLTAMVGAPFFLWLLMRSQQKDYALP